MRTLMMASHSHFSICSDYATFEVAQDPSLLKCDPAYVDEWLPAFQRIFKDTFPLHMKVTPSFKTSGTTHPRIQQHIPEDLNPQNISISFLQFLAQYIVFVNHPLKI
jgi:hypothetical protein